MTRIVMMGGPRAQRRGSGGANGTAKEGAAQTSASAPLNLNTATAVQLEALPGIGKSTAERIVEYRQKNASFKKAEDL